MIDVLIQAEAGSREKMLFDEKTLKPTGTGRVSRQYPYPYGFVLNTTATDGDNADCYVFSNNNLEAGTIVTCEVVGLLEQVESGEPDHKVLAVVAGQQAALPDRALEVLQDFIYAIFSHYPDTAVEVGPIYPRDTALRYLRKCRRR